MVDRRVIALMACGGLLATSSTASAQRWGREAEPRNGACFYEDADYGGNYFCLRSGERLDSIPDGMNDRISSIRTFGDVDVTVFRDRSYNGSSARFDYDVPNLRQGNWNDRISSIQVGRSYARGQSRDGYYGRDDGYDSRSGYRGRADGIVRRAYLSVLNREPDRNSQGYVERVLRDGWTQQDVERELRQSPEFRSRIR
jgi:hypothetical protein